jgi:hypothetical protein
MPLAGQPQPPSWLSYGAGLLAVRAEVVLLADLAESCLVVGTQQDPPCIQALVANDLGQHPTPETVCHLRRRGDGGPADECLKGVNAVVPGLEAMIVIAVAAGAK